MLISTYIATIPVNGDASCIVEQTISFGPPVTAVNNAMTANVGAAARRRTSAVCFVIIFSDWVVLVMRQFTVGHRNVGVTNVAGFRWTRGSPPKRMHSLKTDASEGNP